MIIGSDELEDEVDPPQVEITGGGGIDGGISDPVEVDQVEVDPVSETLPVEVDPVEVVLPVRLGE